MPVGSELRTATHQREELILSMKQFPIVVNHATTVHKLQGKTLDKLFIHEWNYRGNWIYVALSRVRTREGLFLNHPLSRVLTKYKANKELDDMLAKFRQFHTPDDLAAEEESQMA